MNRPFHSAIVCLLAAGTAWGSLTGCASGSSPRSTADGTVTAEERAAIEKEIRALEEAFNGAYGRNDMNTYWPFYADGLTQLWDTGRVSLEQYKKDWNGMLEAGGAILEVRMEDVQVHVSPSGDAAVASYRIFVRMRDAQAKETAAWYHESDTWFRGESGWKIVHLHYSAAGAPQGSSQAGTAHGSL